MAGKIIGSIITPVVVGLTLVIALYCYSCVEIATYPSFVASTTNENLGTVSSIPTTLYTDYYPISPNSETITIVNTTSGETVDSSPDYTIDYEIGEVTITGTTATLGSDTVAYANYTYYLGDAYELIRKIGINVTKGFQLSSVLPIVLFTATIIAGLAVLAMFK